MPLGKFACRRPALIAVRLGQPKAKPTFRNIKGKTAILCIIGKPAQIGMLFSIGGQSVFEIGIVGADCNPRTCFIKVYLCGFLRFFSILFSSLHAPFKNYLFFLRFLQEGDFWVFFIGSRPVKNECFSIEMLQTMRTALNYFLFRKSWLLQLKSSFAAWSECCSCPCFFSGVFSLVSFSESLGEVSRSDGHLIVKMQSAKQKAGYTNAYRLDQRVEHPLGEVWFHIYVTGFEIQSRNCHLRLTTADSSGQFRKRRYFH